MNKQEYLLVCVMEECSEIIKLCSKSLRFGIMDHQPNRSEINRDLLIQELCDLIGVLEELEELGIVLSPVTKIESLNKIRAKREKLAKYMKISQQSGHLNN